ncbi:cytochrome P450 [Dactylonectria estremocensis]|uniref:Cytochrome P450 n=1 Tax=Dactylonectria estremocensis TaxID=1079267 RepID=A0A9P9EZ43_9HYPO|nr:cytochrome P450 [Dactylonectria estremocensis]
MTCPAKYRVIQQKLTPTLASLTTAIKEELDLALSLEMPEMRARVLLRPEDSRNEEWLHDSGVQRKLDHHRFRSSYLSSLPRPTLLHNLSSGPRIICGIISSREAQQKTPSDAHQNILQWMMDAATGREKVPENLAQRTLILSLASIRTTAMTMTHAMYDLCAYLELYKLDSLLKESQRFNPVFRFVTFNRIFHKALSLSDGTHPAGTRIAGPSHAMLEDPVHIRENSESAQKFLFSLTDSSNMGFGYRKHACPGRFYASNEMKLVLANLLLRYKLKLPHTTERPRNITIDSDMFPDPRARLYVRKR